MSRKRKAPVRKVYPDPKFHSEVVSKFINSIMYDGKRSTAEKILYDALDKIKVKNNEDPIKIFNTAISNVKPNFLNLNFAFGLYDETYISASVWDENSSKKNACDFVNR